MTIAAVSAAELADLTGWIELESPTNHPPGVEMMMTRVAADLAEVPVAIEQLPGRDGLASTLVVRAGPHNGLPPLVVMSHLDTVHPVGTRDRDLPVRLEGDRLYGPGAYDMKSGAWLALQAFKDVVRTGTAKRPLTYLFTPDEEIGSPTTRGVIEAEGRGAAAVLVTEPARDVGRIVTARKGVGRFEVRVEGRPAHSGSRHQDGRSAIREAARQILAVEGLTDYARGVTTTVALMSGGTAANVVPQHAWFTVDLRVATVADGEEFERRILDLAAHDPDVRVTVTGGMNRPPYEKTPDVANLYETARSLAAEFGFDLQDTAMTGGGSDGNFTAAVGAPTLDGLGADGDGAHTLQEYALVSSIPPRRELMRRLLETI